MLNSFESALEKIQKLLEEKQNLEQQVIQLSKLNRQLFNSDIIVVDSATVSQFKLHVTDIDEAKRAFRKRQRRGISPSFVHRVTAALAKELTDQVNRSSAIQKQARFWKQKALELQFELERLQRQLSEQK